MSEPTRTAPSLLQGLRERRMLPTAIAYFGLMWALLEFTGFIVARYALRDVWIDVAFVAIFAPSSLWLQVRLARAQGEERAHARVAAVTRSSLARSRLRTSGCGSHAPAVAGTRNVSQG